ncbi:MAG: glycosyltransferase family 4 protein, partial [Candidatus Eisenbacteria bacterium]|nr:glycosyltransferase family 4 protein [Candidatus Eisenbacteria bacterium]
VIAPQPYFQERGTPIAVRLLVRALGERGDEVDLLVYHEGSDVATPGVTVHRIRPRPTVRGIRPGFSLKKVYCDLFLIPRIDRMLRDGQYDLVHATEEGVFLAHWLCRRHRIPFVYDMDSSMSHQILDRHGWLAPLRPWLEGAEARAMRAAVAVVPVCEALADVARSQGVSDPYVLKDVSLVEETATGGTSGVGTGEPVDIRALPGWQDRAIAMYIGNLEPYQGIDLLLESFRHVLRQLPAAGLVVVGGVPDDVEKYRRKSRALEIEGAVQFLGQRPVAHVGAYMRQADLLVSPRIHGQNTPMKVYTYLDSGVAVLATDLPTHTQVMNSTLAGLAPAEPAPFAREMIALLEDPSRRRELAGRARELIRREHSYGAFRERVHALYDRLENLPRRKSPAAPPSLTESRLPRR